MISALQRPLRSRGAALAIIAAAIFAAYANSFHGPFVFDGSSAILENSSIRHLWTALHPPMDGSPVTGRPLTNLTFALNYAAGHLSVGGYHGVNFLLHLGAAFLLFGIVRRTWRQTVPAAAAALLWAAHPLQTESVTYVAQRSELLMGVCYLATLYAFIRAARAEPDRATPWYLLSVAACVAGMAAKEVMVTAPVLVLLYDCTFLSGSVVAASRRRPLYYSALAATWLLLAYLVLGSGTRGGTIGFATPVRWNAYALMQVQAVTHYLRLSFWPHPLVLDYGLRVSGLSLIVGCEALFLLLLAVAAIIALWRRHPAGYLGAWFFMILAPTSSVVPVATEIIAEHRMYLPLAAVITLGVAVLWRWIGPKVWPAFAAAAVGLIVMTSARNRDYRSARDLWSQTAAAVPDNAGVHNNLAAALLSEDRLPEAADEFNAALRLDPTLAGTHNNLGRVRLRQGQPEAAIAQFATAVQLAPTYPEARTGLAFAYFAWGNQLAGRHQLHEAIQALERSVAIDPNQAEAQGNLAGALLDSGQPAAAFEHCEAALRLKPDLIEARLNLGNALLELRRPQEAIAAYRQVLALRPNFGAAHHNLAAALHAVGQDEEARAELQRAGEAALK